MKAFGFSSIIAVILTFDLQTRAEQDINDNIFRSATPVDITDTSLAEKYFVNQTNYGSSQNFFLAVNVAVFVDTNVYADRIGVYTSEPGNLGSRQSLIESMPYVWLEAKPDGATSRGINSRNKSDNNFSLIDVEFWPFMQGKIHNDLEYYVRLATSGPIDQFEAERLFDAGPGYSTIEPEIGFSWLSRKMGTELSIFSGLTMLC